MSRSLIVLICLLWPSDGVSSYGVKIPLPKLSRKYPPCTRGNSSQNCIVECSSSDVPQAQLSWNNGSASLYNLTLSPYNRKLYLEVDHQDKNNYSCTVMVSSSGISQTTHLDKNLTCQTCPETTIMPVSEGESVTLSTHLKERQNEIIEWVYENNSLIAKLEQTDEYHYCDDGRFRDRLQLDFKTGSLTIKNISKIHSGPYEPKIIDQSQIYQQCQSYNVTVYDPLPVPVITKDSTRCSSSSKCVVMCSVNVTHVSLSWYNGNRLLSSISVSDLKRSNFLCLEVENQDTNTYSCVVNNSFANKTTRLNISELCKDQQKYLGFLGFLVLVLVFIPCLIWQKKKFSCQQG